MRAQFGLMARKSSCVFLESTYSTTFRKPCFSSRKLGEAFLALSNVLGLSSFVFEAYHDRCQLQSR